MSLQYKEYGNDNAPLMLLLHGGGVSGWMWDKQVQYFSRYHCIVPDLPGHGVSFNNINFSIKETAEKLIKLIENKAIDKTVIVIGFSLGAQILVQMLSSKPNLIDYAIINSALVRPLPFTTKFIGPLTKISYPLIKLKSFSKIQARTLYIGDEYFEQFYKETCQMKIETLVTMLKQNMSFKIPANFEHAKGKILITVGEKEKSVMRKSAIDLHKKNTNSKAIIFKNIGHGVSLENPILFNQMVENWINKDIISNKDIIVI